MAKKIPDLSFEDIGELPIQEDDLSGVEPDTSQNISKLDPNSSD